MVLHSYLVKPGKEGSEEKRKKRKGGKTERQKKRRREGMKKKDEKNPLIFFFFSYRFLSNASIFPWSSLSPVENSCHGGYETAPTSMHLH